MATHVKVVSRARVSTTMESGGHAKLICSGGRYHFQTHGRVVKSTSAPNFASRQQGRTRTCSSSLYCHSIRSSSPRPEKTTSTIGSIASGINALTYNLGDSPVVRSAPGLCGISCEEENARRSRRKKEVGTKKTGEGALGSVLVRFCAGVGPNSLFSLAERGLRLPLKML